MQNLSHPYTLGLKDIVPAWGYLHYGERNDAVKPMTLAHIFNYVPRLALLAAYNGALFAKAYEGLGLERLFS